MDIQSAFLFLKNNHDFIPLVSAATSLFKLLQIAIYSEDYTRLKKTAVLRNVVLLIPVFGNIAVAIYDLKKNSERLFTLKAVKADGLSLEHASKENQDDEEIVQEAVLNNSRALAFASCLIRNKEGFFEKYLPHDISLFRFAGCKVLSNEAFTFRMYKTYGTAFLRYVKGSFLKNEGFMERAIEVDVSALKFSKNLRNNQAFVSKMMIKQESVLRYAGKLLRKDVAYIRQLTDENISLLQYAHESLRSNEEFISERIDKNRQALKFSSLKKNKAFIAKRIYEDLSFLEHVDDELKDDKDFIRRFNGNNFEVIQYLNDCLRENLDYNIQCVYDYGLSLRFVSPAFKTNQEFVLTYVKAKMWGELELADESLMKSHSFARKCVKENLRSFDYFHPSLRNDQEFVNRLKLINPKVMSDEEKRKEALDDARLSSDLDTMALSEI